MKKLTTLVAGAFVASPLAAQTRIHVDASAPPGGDGTSWVAAFDNLQDALTASEGATGGAEIWVAAGIYVPDPGGSDRTRSFQLRDDVAIYGGFSGGETDLSGRNPNAASNGTVLSGDLGGDDGPGFTNIAENSQHVVEGTGTGPGAILDGFTIRGGNADTFPAVAGGGGLLCNKSGSPTVTGCRFTANKAISGAGAVTLTTQSPGVTAPVFTDCTFTGNEGFYGGAIDIASSQPQFIRCRIESNVGNFYGGAVYNYYSASRFIDCSFRGNRAGQNGGAIYFNNVDPAGPAVIINTEFVGNLAGFGGACYSYAYAVPVFTNSTFQGNRATQLGGALYQAFSAVPRYSNCVVWGNLADAAATTLDHSVTSFNVSPEFSHSLVAHAGGSGAWDAAAGTDLGGNLDVDPLLVIPADPALAPTTAGDVRLGLSSPAANQGNNLADLDGPGAGLQTIDGVTSDLAGEIRILDLTIDLGAYEGTFENTLTSFATLFPGLDPSGDENGNGLSNFTDYATGADPTAPDQADCRPRLSGTTFTTSHRIDTTDVIPILRKSIDLVTWSPLVEGIDYNVQGTTTVGDREQASHEILIDPTGNPRIFLRQEFVDP